MYVYIFTKHKINEETDRNKTKKDESWENENKMLPKMKDRLDVSDIERKIGNATAQ